MGKRLLIVDDDSDFVAIVTQFLEFEGFTVDAGYQPEQISQFLSKNQYDGILLDVNLGPNDGLDLVPLISKKQEHAKIIVITSRSSVPLAVRSMEVGASSFLEKTTDPLTLVSQIREKLTSAQMSQIDENLENCGIIGNSPKIKELIDKIHQIKNFDTNVLILGESGTGKELVAKAIHKVSRRSQERFEAINCGAIPETLLESELFGYKKGAFTDARADRKGLFEVCSKGSLFLDELGEIPLSMQVKLLRVLQEREVRPLGSDNQIPIDTRIIAATNRNLEEEISQNSFREDLYYRLAVFPIYIPPLRERSQDIQYLADFFISKVSKRYQIEVEPLQAQDIEKLQAHSWKGNIRELQNVIERAIITSNQGVLNFSDFRASSVASKNEPYPFDDFNYSKAKENFEVNFLKALLQKTAGNIAEAARISGRYRSDIYRLIERYGLDLDSFKRSV